MYDEENLDADEEGFDLDENGDDLDEEFGDDADFGLDEEDPDKDR